MATIDLNSAQLWTSSFNSFLDKQQNTSSYSNAKFVCKTTSSQNQPASSYDKVDWIFKYKDSFRSTIAARRHQEDGFTAGLQGTFWEYFSWTCLIIVNITDHNNSIVKCNNKVDNKFSSINELWRQNSLHKILTKYQDSADTLQHPEESVLYIGSRLDLENSRLNNNMGNSQGTRGTQQLSITVASSLLTHADKLVILEDDESETLDLKVAVISVLVDDHADPPFEPSTES